MADARELMDRALLVPKGIIITFAEPGHLVQFRHRCYTARQYDKRATRKVYPVDHPGYNHSPWDELTFDRLNDTQLRIVRGTLEGGRAGIQKIEEVK